MKYILLLSALFIPFLVSAQHLIQNETTNNWEYVEVFDVPNTSKSELFKRIKNNYIMYAGTIQSEEVDKKIVIRYSIRLGTFKHAMMTETFDIRDNKIRWILSDIVYLKAITNLSKYKDLNKTSDKRIIKKVNKLLPEGVKRIKDKIVTPPQEKDDW